jgi:hypothetical protein
MHALSEKENACLHKRNSAGGTAVNLSQIAVAGAIQTPPLTKTKRPLDESGPSLQPASASIE